MRYLRLYAPRLKLQCQARRWLYRFRHWRQEQRRRIEQVLVLADGGRVAERDEVPF